MYSLVQALCGVVFADIESGRINALINRRAQRAYRSSNYWTRFLKIGEERFLASDPIASTAIVSGTAYFIESPGNTDFTLIGSTSNEAGTYFVATGSGSGTGTARPALGHVPYSETGKDNIDTFMRIFQQAPYVSASVNEFDFTVSSDGAKLICGNLNPLTAFVTYKAEFDEIYDNESIIPAEWFHYIAHGTYADYLRAEGQQEKAALADQEAEVLLTEELIRLDENHTSGFVSNRIKTNANMQLRWS